MPAYTEYFVQLVNKRTKMPINDDTGKFNVMTAGTPVVATVYGDQQGGAKTLPGTMTDGIIQFWAAQSVESVDVTGLTASGHPFFIAGLTPSQHRYEVNVDDCTSLCLVLPFEFTASAAVTLLDTGFDLNALHLVKDIFAKVTTAGGTGTVLQVGVSGTACGLLAAAACSATGYKNPTMDVLSLFVAATAAATSPAARGVLLLVSSTNQNSRAFYAPGAATSIIYKDANSTAGTGSGYIYMVLDKLVV